MNQIVQSEKFRVTSVPFRSTDFVIFTGVPLAKRSYRINSGKYSVSVRTKLESLPTEPAVGQHWAIEGKRKVSQHDINGFKIDQHTYDAPTSIECCLPETGEQLIQFIANEPDFKGIGQSKARALWDALGKDFHDIARKDNEDSRKRLREHLTEDSIDSLFKGYEKYKNLRDFNWMSKHKIPASVQQKLIKYHGEKSLNQLRRNPYLLMTFGMSFKTTDDLAQTLFECMPSNENRLSAALEWVLVEDIKRGNTYTPQKNIRRHLIKLLGDAALADNALKVGYDKAQYLLNRETGNYHQSATLLMESVIAKRLIKLAQRISRLNECASEAYSIALSELPYELTERQQQAVTTCLNNDVACITGGAGTGKTTVLRTALQAFHGLKYQIHAIALSGRAAMRLHESIGFETSTIAAFLRNEPIEPTHETPFQLVVIDEASMIDVPTMYRLVNHIHPLVRIIFTGDPDQLPPIGCGKVLSDIVESGIIKNTTLDIVKRQEDSTGIPEYSKLINTGVVPVSLSTGNIVFHETDERDVIKCCTNLFAQSSSNTRVMAPTRKLVADINAEIQKACNKDGSILQFMMHGESYYQNLRKGDEVLFTQNNYQLGFQNGSLGTLISVDFNREKKIYGQVKLDTNEIIDITDQVLDCIELGYAITLHKAQGSQFPRIIVVLKNGLITDRSWLYTAITRAESEVHLVGKSSDFKVITETISNSNKRNSYLGEMLRM